MNKSRDDRNLDLDFEIVVIGKWWNQMCKINKIYDIDKTTCQLWKKEQTKISSLKKHIKNIH